MPTIAVVGAKGGTTKTATVAALADLFAAGGFDVAMVDLDPQGSLTRRHGIERAVDPLGTEPIRIAVEGRSPGFGQITIFRGGRALEMADEVRAIAHLRRAASSGDIVLIDTPPALGPVVRAALRIADLVLVPSTPGAESLDGFADMRSVALAMVPGRPVRAVLSLAHSRSRILSWSQEQLRSVYPDCHYPDVVVPFEVAAAESAVHRLPVTVSAARSRSAAAYRRLVGAIASDLGLAGLGPEEVAT